WSPLGGTGGGASAVGERFEQIRRIADAHAVSPQQVVRAWEIALGEHVIPIPGASRPESITASAAAMRLGLTDAEREELERLFVTAFRGGAQRALRRRVDGVGCDLSDLLGWQDARRPTLR